MKFKSPEPFRNPLVLPLDVDNSAKIESLVQDLGDLVGGFKLGPRLINRFGASMVRQIAGVAPVFIDCKYFDIPSTMNAALKSCFELGASVVTIHALSGPKAMAEVAKLQDEFRKNRPFRILAVTILTSFSQDTLPRVLREKPMEQLVRSLAQDVRESGLDGIVCSPHELDIVRDLDLFCLTPGIRQAQDSANDQERIMGPREALEKGSSALVVGRPILEAPNPRQAALDFLQKMKP
jgi:orotidine-5'-phosphate decarboxylase